MQNMVWFLPFRNFLKGAKFFPAYVLILYMNSYTCILICEITCVEMCNTGKFIIFFFVYIYSTSHICIMSRLEWLLND